MGNQRLWLDRSSDEHLLQRLQPTQERPDGLHVHTVQAAPAPLTPFNPRRPVLQRQSALLSLGAVHGNQFVRRVIGGSHGTVHSGSRGPDVSALQEALNAEGAGLTVDGIFGAKTGQALVAYQQAHGLPADGIAGPQTWALIEGKPLPAGPGGSAGKGQAGAGRATAIHQKLAQIQALLVKIRKTHRPAAQAPTVDNTPAPAQTMAPFGMDDPEGTDSWSVGSLLGLDDMKKKAEDVVGSAKNWVDEKVDSVVGTAAGVAKDVGEWVDDKAKTIGGAVSGAESWVDEKVGQAGAWVSGKVDAAGQTLAEIKQAAEQTVSGVEKEISTYVDDLKTRYADEIAGIQQAIQDIGRGFYSPALEEKLNEILVSLGEKSEDPADGTPPPHEGTLSPIPNPVAMEAHACEDGELAARAPATQVQFDIQPDFRPAATSDAHPTGQERAMPVQHPWAMDAVDSSGLYVSSSVSRGGLNTTVHDSSPTAVGYSEPQFAEMNMIAFSAHDSKVFVSARLPVSIHYDTDGGGRTEVPDADSPNLNAANWQQAVSALTPINGGKYENAPPLTGFWSPPLTEAHELVHTGQYKTLAEDALDKQRPDLNKKQINGLPWFWWSDSDYDRVNFHLKNILQPVPGKVAVTMNSAYDDGRVGFENAAYGSTAAAYTKLVDGIKARAAKEGWDKGQGKP